MSLLSHPFFSHCSLSKKVKLSGLVTEDQMTGEQYVTHVTVMEETVGAQQPMVQQASHSAPQSEKQPTREAFTGELKLSGR